MIRGIRTYAAALTDICWPFFYFFQPIIAIRPLAVFVQRLQASKGQLTMIHPLLAKVSFS